MADTLEIPLESVQEKSQVSVHIRCLHASMPCNSHKCGPFGVSQITLADVCSLIIDDTGEWIDVIQCYHQALNKSINTSAGLLSAASFH